MTSPKFTQVKKQARGLAVTYVERQKEIEEEIDQLSYLGWYGDKIEAVLELIEKLQKDKDSIPQPVRDVMITLRDLFIEVTSESVPPKTPRTILVLGAIEDSDSSGGNKVHRFGVNSWAQYVFQFVFVAKPPPNSLELALAKAYGKNWRERNINMIQGRGKNSKRSFEEDIRQEDSFFKRFLAGGLASLRRYENGEVDNALLVVRDLYNKIKENYTLDEVETTLNSWGVVTR